MAKKGVGIDIGASSIKIVELSNIGKKPSLVKYGIKELPSDVIVDSHIMDPLLITETIQKILESEMIKTSKVNIGLQGRSVMVKKIETELMNDNEYARQVRFDAQNNFPFDFEDIDISLDFHVIDRIKAEKKMEVLLLAAKTEVIDQQIDPISESGMKVNVVDYNLFALQNCYEKTMGPLDSGNVGFVHIGAEWFLMSIVSDGKPVIARDNNATGTLKITHQMMRKLGISTEDAKKVIMNETPPPPDQLATVTLIYNEFISEVADNISKQEDSSNKKLSKLILSGGGVLIPRLKQGLEEALKKPVEIFNPFAEMNVPDYHREKLGTLGPVLSVAAGLALRG
ncbi:type IV pilus assembly protein PilM [candidate division WOR-3 bacterium]|nr:type IV pilus assembly protein PilM [candidate division WOR-3 bacterium]